MKTVRIYDEVGSFAENKDVGRDIRVREILPALEGGQEVILDFDEVQGATQSFIHSLISDVLRQHGEEVLGQIAFKSCNAAVKQMIRIVVEYMQAAMAEDLTED